ncbi:unnamed protein product [Microthlaspi erraticum]|uniref:GOST seven transmembrane domain-containing protein n=1 Tax=Microthlaspi erraticum TaxID=1685480 RepID=A0A6D2ITV9_9BRAS|nr:unnamed protein product [Microthlaspi erraticum]
MLDVFGIVSLAYLFLGILWFPRIIQSGKQMSQFQHLITMLIALGMFETAVHYYEYAKFNKTGTRPQEVTVWAVTFSYVRKTLLRLLLLFEFTSL